MNRIQLALAVAAVVTIVGLFPVHPVVAQQPACLHGPNESDAERSRKRQALLVARQINTYENAALQTAGTYRPLIQLPNVNPTPQGFEVHAAIESLNYAFAIKDSTDPCGFAYFSDQGGIIYNGEALR